MGNSSTSFLVDFTALPGANGTGMIKVLVSDGANMGQAVSLAFSIAKKTPSLVQINSPTPNFSQPAANPLILMGTAFDTDDGVLTGAALSWSSNLQGNLGTGSQLSVSLQPGVHTITLTATDSDNNSISTSTIVTIGGQPPQLSVNFNVLSEPPSSGSTCVQAQLDAAPGPNNGAPVSSVQYSVDSGNTFTSIPASQLPYTFLIPGSGFMGLVFNARDTSNQITAQSTTFFNLGTCGSLSAPNVVGMTLANATASLGSYALPVGATTQAASATVTAGTVVSQNPAAGSSIAAGASDSVNLVISSGAQVAIPNVVGQSQANAASAITGAGLALGTVTQQTSTAVASGNVISQSPSAGTAANAGATVGLVVSTGSALAIPNPSSLPVGTVAFPYSAVVTATGGSGNYTWSAPGLPSGLVIDNTGAISGTPTVNTGSPFSVLVTVTDSVNSTSTNRGYSLTIDPAIALTAPGALPAGTIGAAYTATTAHATGGNGNYTWSASGLPTGMIIGAATGVISGRPMGASGSYNVTLAVADSTLAGVSTGLTLTINPAAFSACDINQDGSITVADVQRELNEALGLNSGANDLNSDGVVNAADVQIMIQAVLSSVCTAL